MKNAESLKHENRALKAMLNLEDATFPFICGVSDSQDSGFPDSIQVCIAPGSDLVCFYDRREE